MARDADSFGIDAIGGAAEGLLSAVFESIELFAAVFELFPAEYRFLLANRTTAGLYHRTPAQMLGLTGADLGVAPRSIAERVETLWSCWNAKKPLTREFALQRAGDDLRWFLGVFTPLAGETPRVSLVAVDLTARKRAQIDAEQEGRRLRVALEAANLGLWEYEIADDHITWDDRMRELFGVPQGTPIDFALYLSRLHPDDAPKVLAAYQAAISGETGGKYGVEHRTMDAQGRTRWARGFGQVIFGEDGRPLRVIGAAVDITAEVEARERQQLLLAELNHRVKNNLATVQSMALQTARMAPDLPRFVETFEGRIIALSRTHDVLTANAWASADLMALLSRELEAVDDRAIVRGEPVRLSARQALALGMIVHELVTNAAKYGALSVPAGTVTVEVARQADGRVTVSWREAGGPRTPAPAREGFGMRLIRKLAGGDLQGKVVLTFTDQGLEADLSFVPEAEAS